MKNIFVTSLSAIVLCILSAGCSSTKEIETLAVEERFRLAREKFEKEDYLEAIEDFKAITVQYQGSEFADDAQFDLAECRFRRGEYILAAAEYDLLIRTMSSSPLVPRARYMKALSYYFLSPKPELDQKYTLQAIDDFQTFLEYSPTDSLAKDAEGKITELNNKLARKEFESGRLYITMEYYKAAIAYFNNVLERFHDSEFADDALYWKAYALKQRKEYAAARDAVRLFLEKYPGSELRKNVESLLSDLEKESLDTVKAKASGITGKL